MKSYKLLQLYHSNYKYEYLGHQLAGDYISDLITYYSNRIINIEISLLYTIITHH